MEVCRYLPRGNLVVQANGWASQSGVFIDNLYLKSPHLQRGTICAADQKAASKAWLLTDSSEEGRGPQISTHIPHPARPQLCHEGTESFDGSPCCCGHFLFPCPFQGSPDRANGVGDLPISLVATEDIVDEN